MFLFLILLIRIAFLDMKTMEISNKMNGAVAVLGVVSYFTVPGVSLTERILGVFAVSFPMTVITFLVPGGFGEGDIKLMAAAGLFLGWRRILLAAFLGIFSGGIYGSWLLLRKKAEKKDFFPFGPFLCGGLAAALLAGEEILRWYF